MRMLRFIILLILVISLTISIGQSEISRAREKDMQVKEEIELEIGYFILPPEEYWGTNVRFKISVPELLNLSSKYEHLMSLEYEMIKRGKNALMNLNLTFGRSNLIDVAETVSRDILKIFNHTTLQIIHKSGPIEKISTTEFLYQFGEFPYSLETVLSFLRYKPKTGFGELIDEDFLSAYIPGNATKGIVYLAYTWTKGLGWYLTIESSINMQYSPGQKIVNLNELIKNEKPITTSNQGVIRVFIWNWTLGARKYIFRVLHITPLGYVQKRSKESITYEWVFNDSIQNVVVILQTERIPQHRNNSVIYGIVITIVVTVSVIIVYIVRRTSSSKTHSLFFYFKI